MNHAIKTLAFTGLSLLALATSSAAHAAATEALASCKAHIADDSRMASYETVVARLDDLRPSARYTDYRISIDAKATDGTVTEWVADCRARDRGHIVSLELAEVTRPADLEVASGQ